MERNALCYRERIYERLDLTRLDSKRDCRIPAGSMSELDY